MSFTYNTNLVKEFVRFLMEREDVTAKALRDISGIGLNNFSRWKKLYADEVRRIINLDAEHSLKDVTLEEFEKSLDEFPNGKTVSQFYLSGAGGLINKAYYHDNFAKEVCRYLRDSGCAIITLSKHSIISENTIGSWVKKYKDEVGVIVRSDNNNSLSNISVDDFSKSCLQYPEGRTVPIFYASEAGVDDYEPKFVEIEEVEIEEVEIEEVEIEDDEIEDDVKTIPLQENDITHKRTYKHNTSEVAEFYHGIGNAPIDGGYRGGGNANICGYSGAGNGNTGTYRGGSVRRDQVYRGGGNANINNK